jgi:hypothetical protein
MRPAWFFLIIDSQNFALLVESHVPYVQFWHIGITRSLNKNLRIRAPLSHILILERTW